MTEFVDIFDLSRRGAEIEGEALVRDLPGLTAFTATDAGRLAFSARGMGERRGLPAARLSMEGDVEMFCARCNKPVPVHIASEAVFRFAESEEAANALPIEEDEEDEDVAVGSKHFNLTAWLEEEAILSLPRMAFHETCEEGGGWHDAPEAAEEKRPNPFAALAAFKKSE